MKFTELIHRNVNNELDKGRSNPQCNALPNERNILEGLISTLLAKMEINKNINPDANILKATIDSLEKSKKQIFILNETLSDSVEILEMLVENTQTYQGTNLIISGIKHGVNDNLEVIVQNKLINYLHLPKTYVNVNVLNPKAHLEGILIDCSTKLTKNIILHLAKQKLGASEIKIEDFLDLNLIYDSNLFLNLDIRMKMDD